MAVTVTIVDDCDELRHMTALLLERELGVACLRMASLADVQAHSYEVIRSELVILDINLGAGEPDGVAVYEWLRNQSYQGKVFFFTGHAKGSPHVRRAAETGVPIIEKPMSPDEMVLIFKESLAVLGERTQDANI